MKKAANGELGLGTHPTSEPEPRPQVGPLLLCAADLPLSLVGDVVTLPYTAAYSCVNQPVPVPPFVYATAQGPPQAPLGAVIKEPEEKAPEQKPPAKDDSPGKPKDDDNPAPMPRSP
jgi:hypothetical protein